MKKGSGRISGSIISLYKTVFSNKPIKHAMYEKEVLGRQIKGIHVYAYYRVDAGSFVTPEEEARWHRVGTLAPRI